MATGEEWGCIQNYFSHGLKKHTHSSLIHLNETSSWMEEDPAKLPKKQTEKMLWPEEPDALSF